MNFGFEYTTVAIDPEKYLVFLLRSFRALGGTVLSGIKVASLSEVVNGTIAEGQFDIVVNCTGIGAASLLLDSESKTLVDPHMDAVRGQTVLIKAPLVTKSTMADPSYVIPRFDGEGTVCVGGTYQPNEWSLEYEADMVASMLWKAVQLDPAVAGVARDANPVPPPLKYSKTSAWSEKDGKSEEDENEDQDPSSALRNSNLIEEEREEPVTEADASTSKLESPLEGPDSVPALGVTQSHCTMALPKYQSAAEKEVEGDSLDHVPEEHKQESFVSEEEKGTIGKDPEGEVHVMVGRNGVEVVEPAASNDLLDTSPMHEEHIAEELPTRQLQNNEEAVVPRHQDMEAIVDAPVRPDPEVDAKQEKVDSVVSFSDLYPSASDVSTTSSLDHSIETHLHLPSSGSSTSTSHNPSPIPTASIQPGGDAFASHHAGAVEEIMDEENRESAETESVAEPFVEEVEESARDMGIQTVESEVAGPGGDRGATEDWVQPEIHEGEEDVIGETKTQLRVATTSTTPVTVVVPRAHTHGDMDDECGDVVGVESEVEAEHGEGGRWGSGSRSDLGSAVEGEVEDSVSVATAEPASIRPKTVKEEIEAKGFSLPPGIEILKVNVGLRPQRAEGTRLESETMVAKDGKKVLVVHNYGHGGWGFQSSWGSANAAVLEIEKYFPQPPSSLWGKLVAAFFGQSRAKL
ncbi:hypothetical protein HDU93_000320 [Gonapodya sp. JEL0774]|nr:hypothetical protein HDU93_000320 [Gonapodya sp. JEL0774]